MNSFIGNLLSKAHEARQTQVAIQVRRYQGRVVNVVHSYAGQGVFEKWSENAINEIEDNKGNSYLLFTTDKSARGSLLDNVNWEKAKADRKLADDEYWLDFLWLDLMKESDRKGYSVTGSTA
jgi:hypothetical protein